MKLIKLTRNKEAIVDKKNFNKLNQYKWHAHFDNNNWYAYRSAKSEFGYITLSMHREILIIPKHLYIDHINGNGLDNRRENLRVCTDHQNKFNKKLYKNNKLKIKGVRIRKESNKFQSRIGINGKSICLGCFNVLGDADSVYRNAAEKYFGEFTRKDYK